MLTACALLSRAYVLHVRTALPSRLYAYGFNVRTAYEAIALGIYEERAYGLHVRTACALPPVRTLTSAYGFAFHACL